MDARDLEHEKFLDYNPEVVSLSAREIEYLDTKPKPFITQVPLVEYFERVKRHKADKWQHNFCQRLQEAAENRHLQQTLAITHAEAQLGKSVIQAQVYSSWLLGHEPEHRIVLGTYNIGKSEDHSEVVIRQMQSAIHKDIFPNKDGWIKDGIVAKEKWSTFARKDINDAQFSFRAVGLESGITGSGADTYIIDDPYRKAKDAFSETIRKNLQNFWDNDISSRLGLHSNVFAMFHRYHVEDFAGYLLDTGDFDYWRYATVCDGDFIHEETGKIFHDPLNRSVGEYISPERRKPIYYSKKRENNRVWLSMFQGRPSSEEGDFFSVGKITVISAEQAAQRKLECVVLVRAWDLAATEEGGDYSVGTLMGMRADGGVTKFDVVRKQVESAGRDKLQKETAEKDGKDVVISIPEDPGAAGKTTVLHIKQLLKGFEVVTRSTSGSKEDRARNYASAVNSGEVEFADDSYLPEDRQWIKETKKELRDFPLSEHKDIVDSSADAYNECFERKAKGLVINNYKPTRNLVGWMNFKRLFPHIRPAQAIPEDWRIYVGVKITDEASKPNSALIVARASLNANLGESLFVLAEYKKYDNNFYALFDWLNSKLRNNFSKTLKENIRVFLHPESESYSSTIKQKLNFNISLFKHDETAGLTETNWYLLPKPKLHPFYDGERASGLYLIVDDNQLSVATNDAGLVNLRQEFTTWGFNEKGEPTKVGQVAECLRMICYGFKTYAVPLTDNELIEIEIAKRSPNLAAQNLMEGKSIPAGRQMARIEEENRIRKQLGLEKEDISDFILGEEDY